MKLRGYQQAFGAADITGAEMNAAIKEWFDLYYRDKVTDGEDPCQRIACTVVTKLIRTIFAENCVAVVFLSAIILNLLIPKEHNT